MPASASSTRTPTWAGSGQAALYERDATCFLVIDEVRLPAQLDGPRGLLGVRDGRASWRPRSVCPRARSRPPWRCTTATPPTAPTRSSTSGPNVSGRCVAPLGAFDLPAGFGPVRSVHPGRSRDDCHRRGPGPVGRPHRRLVRRGADDVRDLLLRLRLGPLARRFDFLRPLGRSSGGPFGDRHLIRLTPCHRVAPGPRGAGISRARCS